VSGPTQIKIQADMIRLTVLADGSYEVAYFQGDRKLFVNPSRVGWKDMKPGDSISIFTAITTDNGYIEA
jgi:hypothetical protein